MADKYYRSTYVNVDLKAILANYQAIGRLHPNKTVMPVVKANGYGLGSIEIASFLEAQGVTFFAVATLDEAIELRMHGIKAKILILGVVPPEAIDKAIQHRVALTVPSESWLDEALAHIDEKNEKRLWLHVKLDTGMGRLGIKDTEEYGNVIARIEAHPHVIFEGVYTHFACADMDASMTDQQYQAFKTMVNTFELPQYIHAQNSAGSLMKDAPFCNVVRLGISLYGYYPSTYVAENVKVHLRPAAQWVTQIVQTKMLEPGETVSYGATFTAPEAMKIAILPVGYADGYKRLMQGAYVNAQGHQCEVIGRVCMDQTMIHIPDDVEVGDKVILLDHHEGNPQSAEALAEQQQTINYEVLCNLSRRLPKVYFNDDEIDITNDLLK